MDATIDDKPGAAVIELRHELQSAMTRLSLPLEAISETLSTEDPKPDREVLLDVQRHARHLNALIDWLLDPSLPKPEFAAPATRSSQPERPVSVTGQPIILIAEDDPDIRAQVQRVLGDTYAVVEAGDGEDAWQLIESQRPDLVLSDVQMPRLDGFGLLERIRGNVATASLPVILMSAGLGEAAAATVVRSGADDYFVKPFTRQNLRTRIAAMLQRAAIRAQTEEQFARLIGQSPMAIAVLRGRNYVVSLANSAMRQVWGKGDDVLGHPVFEVLPEASSAGYRRVLDEVFTTGQPYFGQNEPFRVWRNGEWKTLLFNFLYQPMVEANGAVSAITVMASEVTPETLLLEQIAARQALAENEERLQLALGLAELGTWDFNPATGEIRCNERMLKLFGFSTGAVVTVDAILGAVVENDRARVAEAMQRATDPASGGKYEIEYAIVQAGTRQQHHLRARGQGFFDENGVLTRFVGTALDVTEQKRAEAILKEQARRLERRVEERTIELADTNARLQRSNDDLAQFADTVSKDLRDPLRKIYFFGDLVLKDFRDRLDDEVRGYVGRMTDAARRMTDMVNNLLNFSRFTAETDLSQAVDLDEVLHKSLRRFAAAIRKCEATISLPEPLPTIHGEEAQWQACFDNLLDNSLKFCRSGMPAEISVTFEWLPDTPAPGQRTLKLVLTDNGIGFEPEFAENIFGLFTRLHGYSEYEGSGLGLAICRRVVENHLGSIQAEGALEQGAKFTMLIPEGQG